MKNNFQDAIKKSTTNNLSQSLNDKNLFSFGILEPVTNKVRAVTLDKIDPNPYQPRKTFNQSEMEELAENIKEHGLIQKISLIQQVDEEFKPIKDKYFVVAGERRLRAYKLLRERYPNDKQWQSIECVFEELEGLDRDKYKHRLALVALAENLKRSDLNFVDFAETVVKLKDEFKLTFEELGKKIGKSDGYLKLVSSVYNKMSEELKVEAREKNLGRELIEKKLSADNFTRDSTKSLPAGKNYNKLFSDFRKGRSMEYEFDYKVQSLKEIINNFFAKDLDEKERLINELLK